MFENQQNWLDRCQSESLSNLCQHPNSETTRIVHQYFEVKKQFPGRGPKSSANRRLHESVWSIGAIGLVSYILFEGNIWSVSLEYEGPISYDLLEPDEFAIDIPLSDFLRCTTPIENPRSKKSRELTSNTGGKQ